MENQPYLYAYVYVLAYGQVRVLFLFDNVHLGFYKSMIKYKYGIPIYKKKKNKGEEDNKWRNCAMGSQNNYDTLQFTV